MTTHGWIVLAIGFIVSFLVALGVVEWFLLWVRRHGFRCLRHLSHNLGFIVIGRWALSWWEPDPEEEMT